MFNCLVGRELQQMVGQRPQQVFLMPILAGTDGKQKMSKSLDNYIAVDEPPNDMYGKVMSLPDNLVMDYFELITDVDEDELDDFRKQLASKDFNPMELKKRLAFEIVLQFHSSEAACEADVHFGKVVQNKELPDDIEEARVSFKALQVSGSKAIAIPNMLQHIGLVASKGEARRLLSGGAVQIDGVKVTDNEAIIKDGSIIKAGKRRIRKIVNSD